MLLSSKFVKMVSDRNSEYNLNFCTMSDSTPFGDISRDTLDRSDIIDYTTVLEK